MSGENAVISPRAFTYRFNDETKSYFLFFVLFLTGVRLDFFYITDEHVLNVGANDCNSIFNLFKKKIFLTINRCFRAVIG